ncbi:unnamed protein product [Adineta ricciae]|uniref:Uncharacterized protein n=1 Tax=Adineta ricciae TaxID=249248 RepID=A0A814L634_ADIRI|nr:unnamed protein product [Adineta ricciae]
MELPTVDVSSEYCSCVSPVPTLKEYQIEGTFNENNYEKAKQDIVKACPPASMSFSSVPMPSVQNQNYTNGTGEQIETATLQRCIDNI